MTDRWGFALRPLTGLVPGLAQLRDGRSRLGFALLTVAAATVVVALSVAVQPLRLVTSPARLTVFLGSVTVLSVTMLVSSATSWPSQQPRVLRWGARTLAPVLALGPLLLAGWVLVPQLDVSRATFVAAPVATPSAPETPAPTTPSTNIVSTVPALASDERINVLLLGGDAGPGRWSLRTDSMNLVSLDASSGDAAIIGLPRNLVGAPMPPGVLRDRFPRGFPNLLNAVYTFGASNPDLVVDALGPTEEPGASLITASVSELTGVRIDAFVLVDMQGFIEVVDALGGVDIYVPRDLPAPGNVPGGKHPVRDMTAGWHRMDGTDALSFVRSRKADSDYWRMGRQRCALASIAAQVTPVEIAWRWPALAGVLSERVRTNLTPELLDVLLAVVGTDPSSARSLALVPPRFPSTLWPLDDVRRAVAHVINPAAPALDEQGNGPDPMPAGEAFTTSIAPTSTLPTSTLPPVTLVAEECRVRP